jgi:hypothetical protein
MAVAGWFYRSLTNSFTLCLIWLICLMCFACAARISVGYAFFISYLRVEGWWASG